MGTIRTNGMHYLLSVYVDSLLARSILQPASHHNVWHIHRCIYRVVECVWNVMAHAQKPNFVFRRSGRVYLIRRGRQFSQLLAVEVCASAVVMLDTPCSVVVWRVLDNQSIRQFSIQFPSRTLPCAIMFQLDSTSWWWAVRLLETCRG